VTTSSQIARKSARAAATVPDPRGSTARASLLASGVWLTLVRISVSLFGRPALVRHKSMLPVQGARKHPFCERCFFRFCSTRRTRETLAYRWPDWENRRPERTSPCLIGKGKRPTGIGDPTCRNAQKKDDGPVSLTLAPLRFPMEPPGGWNHLTESSRLVICPEVCSIRKQVSASVSSRHPDSTTSGRPSGNQGCSS
jgi:hypothetical protein